jgi:hypothetical protein
MVLPEAMLLPVQPLQTGNAASWALLPDAVALALGPGGLPPAAVVVGLPPGVRSESLGRVVVAPAGGTQLLAPGAPQLVSVEQLPAGAAGGRAEAIR